jgi:hypothetical protein
MSRFRFVANTRGPESPTKAYRPATRKQSARSRGLAGRAEDVVICLATPESDLACRGQQNDIPVCPATFGQVCIRGRARPPLCAGGARGSSPAGLRASAGRWPGQITRIQGRLVRLREVRLSSRVAKQRRFEMDKRLCGIHIRQGHIPGTGGAREHEQEGKRAAKRDRARPECTHTASHSFTPGFHAAALRGEQKSPEL